MVVLHNYIEQDPHWSAPDWAFNTPVTSQLSYNGTAFILDATIPDKKFCLESYLDRNGNEFFYTPAGFLNISKRHKRVMHTTLQARIYNSLCLHLERLECEYAALDKLIDCCAHYDELISLYTESREMESSSVTNVYIKRLATIEEVALVLDIIRESIK